MKPPKYYDNIYELEAGSWRQLSPILDERVERGNHPDRQKDQTPERLAVREEVQTLKQQNIRRNMV